MGHGVRTGPRRYAVSALLSDAGGNHSDRKEQLRCLKERKPASAHAKHVSRFSTALSPSEGLETAQPRQEEGVVTARRANTAMAVLGGEFQWDPYETTTKREFQYIPGSAAKSNRPQTSLGHTGRTGNNTYQEEFHWKKYSKPEGIRTGTSSGARRNNPHPSQSFMNWRVPRDKKQISPGSKSPWSMPVDEEDVRTAIAAQYRTIYREDYVGIPQGFQVKHAISAPPNWKEKIPHPPVTECRYQYCVPKQNPDVAISMARFGSNTHRDLPAKGIVPTVIFAHINNQEKRNQLTTYQTYFSKGHFF